MDSHSGKNMFGVGGGPLAICMTALYLCLMDNKTGSRVTQAWFQAWPWPAGLPRLRDAQDQEASILLCTLLALRGSSQTSPSPIPNMRRSENPERCGLVSGLKFWKKGSRTACPCSVLALLLLREKISTAVISPTAKPPLSLFTLPIWVSLSEQYRPAQGLAAGWNKGYQVTLSTAEQHWKDNLAYSSYQSRDKSWKASSRPGENHGQKQRKIKAGLVLPPFPWVWL